MITATALNIYTNNFEGFNCSAACMLLWYGFLWKKLLNE